MRFSAWALLVVLLAVMSSEPAHAQFTLTIEPNPVLGGTRNTVTATAVLTAPHNGAFISFFCAAAAPPVQLAPGQTTVQVQASAPPLVSAQTTFTYCAAAAYNGPTLVAQDIVVVDPVQLRMELLQNEILSSTRQVIGTVSLS
ncbi:MAG: hypothetical protein ACRD3R_04020, partial [Terriglobales bacterium]